MDLNIIIKKTVQDICGEIKKDENMDLIKEEVLNPVIEHVIYQLSPYFLKFFVISGLLIIMIVVLIFLNLRIIYK